MHGAGNDFIIVAGDEDVRTDWQKLAIVLCNRHFGIGADGLLVLSSSDMADVRLRIFNADGSEAPTCGNGLRCVAKYCYDTSRSTRNGIIAIETISGVRETRVYPDADNFQVKVSMGKPKIGRNEKPGAIEIIEHQLDITNSSYQLFNHDRLIGVNLISMGNWHAVHFTEDPVNDFPLSEMGPVLEDVFPEGINFEIARFCEDGCLEARVWEHGVGETLACGSGACAIGVAAILKGLRKQQLDVHLPGGILRIAWNKRDDVFLTGPVATVFTGEWPAEAVAENVVDSNQHEKNEVLA